MNMKQFLAKAKAIKPEAAVSVEETHWHHVGIDPSVVVYRIFGAIPKMEDSIAINGPDKEALLVQYEQEWVKMARKIEIKERIEREMAL